MSNGTPKAREGLWRYFDAGMVDGVMRAGHYERASDIEAELDALRSARSHALARIATALEAIQADGLLMRMEGRIPTSAPEHFQEGRAQALYHAVRAEGGE